MSASQATTGYSSTFSVGSGSPIAFDQIAEVKSIKPVVLTVGEVEVTHLLSPNAMKERISTLKDHDLIEITGNFIADASQQLLEQLANALPPQNVFQFQITAPVQGSTLIRVDTGWGFVTKYGIVSLEAEKPIEFTMNLRITGMTATAYQLASGFGAAVLYSRAGFGECLSIGTSAAPSGWTDLDFDDSAWSAPVQNLVLGNQQVYAADYDVPALPADAAWITDSVALHQCNGQVLFRFPFVLSQAADFTLAISAIFNLYEVWVNGTQVYADPTPNISGQTVSSQPVSVTAALLQTGENVLAIKAGTTAIANLSPAPFAIAVATA